MEFDLFMQTRKEALAKYTEISKNRFKQDSNTRYKYCIRPGNNHWLIQRVFVESGRTEPVRDSSGNLLFPGWEVSDDQMDSLFNFKWKPVSNGINFDIVGKHGLKQVINHI